MDVAAAFDQTIFGIRLAEMWQFIAIGFAAQVVDGALGMAFGAIANTLLISVVGMPPAQASYRVHIIKCFTAAASGISHAISGNVDKRMFLRLLLPGVIGGAIGAYGLSNVDAAVIKPLVLGYLALLGVILLLRGMRDTFKKGTARHVGPLGFLGGLLDAIGGGGWGPVVSSSLMLQGTEPRTVVGTVNSAEFFIAVVIAGTFLGQLGGEALLAPTIGLLVGGVAAAPFGAMAAKYLPTNFMLVLVGSVLSASSTIGLYMLLET